MCVIPARRASRRRAWASLESSSRAAVRVASVVTRIPPAAYGAPAMRAANSSPRSPANTRWVWLSTEPGMTQRAAEAREAAAARRVQALVGGGRPGALDRRDAVAVEHERRVAHEAQRPLAQI